jgi:hypothetical protein
MKLFRKWAATGASEEFNRWLEITNDESRLVINIKINKKANRKQQS